MPNNSQRICNWKDYNRALVKRGELILNFNNHFLAKLYYSGDKKRGGLKKYSAQMYEYLLTIKVMLRLPWRATVGFAKKLLSKIFGCQVSVPNYAHANREAKKLTLKIKDFTENTTEGMELAFDSTGVNVYTTSGYHQRRYGKESLCRKKDQWKKIHLGLDLDKQQIVSMVFTESNVNDSEAVDKLSKQIKKKVKSVRADGAYDTERFHKIIHDWGAKALIPPAITSKAQDELKRKRVKKKYLEQRDNIIKTIRRSKDFKTGLKRWKIKNGYHRRSLIESCMLRIKRIFGFNLQHKAENGRINEIITKVNLLNRMAMLGRPQYVIEQT
jgi:transposase